MVFISLASRDEYAPVGEEIATRSTSARFYFIEYMMRCTLILGMLAASPERALVWPPTSG